MGFFSLLIREIIVTISAVLQKRNTYSLWGYISFMAYSNLFQTQGTTKSSHPSPLKDTEVHASLFCKPGKQVLERYSVLETTFVNKRSALVILPVVQIELCSQISINRSQTPI